jgi:hypothetical protein
VRGSIFGREGRFAGNDVRAVEGLEWYRELLGMSPPSATASDCIVDAQVEAAGLR